MISLNGMHYYGGEHFLLTNISNLWVYENVIGNLSYLEVDFSAVVLSYLEIISDGYISWIESYYTLSTPKSIGLQSTHTYTPMHWNLLTQCLRQFVIEVLWTCNKSVSFGND